MHKSIYIAAIAAVTALNAQAADSVTGRVVEAGTFGDGRLFVNLDIQINEPGCTGSRFDVPANHPQVKNWLAIALSASLGGKKVVVHTKGCLNGQPTLSQDADAWFYLYIEP